jgi:hypothetical protein
MQSEQSKTKGDNTGSQSRGSQTRASVGFPEIVFGMHAIVAVALLPFIWDALQTGNLPLVGSLTLLGGLLVGLGVVMRRVAAR